MKQFSGNPEQNDLLAQLEALRLLARQLLDATPAFPDTLINADLRHRTEKFLESDLSALIERLAPDSESEHGQNISETFRHEIQLRDQKIHDFKMSLADAVVELKTAQKTLQKANESNNNLREEIARMQVHTKDLSLKLGSANSSLETHEKALKTATSELEDIRNQSYHQKTLIAKLENQLSEVSKNLAQLSEEHQQTLATLEKTQKDFNHVVTSNTELKKSLDLLEIQEKELVETIDALQKERNHLQSKLNSMLTGLKKSVAYNSISSASGNSSSVLEPSILPPYLPFCFPERLPSAIKFRREIAQTFPAERSQPPSRVPPIFNAPDTTSLPGNEVVRSLIRRPKIKPGHRQSFDFTAPSFHLEAVAIDFCEAQTCEPMPNIRFTTDVSMLYKISKNRQVWWQKITRQPVMTMTTVKEPDPQILTSSFELFMQFIVSTLFRHGCSTITSGLPVRLKDNKSSKDCSSMIFSNNFNEILAFRHRLQLKSTMLTAPRITLTQNFRGNRLKSVLETFGNTISSMVNKIESIPNSRSGNGENL